MVENSSFVPAVYLKVLKQLGFLLLITQLVRLIFFIINFNYFSIDSIPEYLRIVFLSLRFDLSAVFSVNSFYIVFALLPFTFVSARWMQKVLQLVFIITNSVAFVFDIADIGYFPYVRKRMTADVFDLIGNKSDFLDLLPNYLTKFWYVSLLIVAVLLLFVFLYNRLFKKVEVQNFSIKNVCIYLAFLALTLIEVRGGVQLRPITLSNAVIAGKNQNIPLVTNTPFSILQTFESNKIVELHFFREDELKQYYDPIKNYASQTAFKPHNVVVIVLESFGKGFTGIGGRQSFTPFLDSLMQQGMTFNYAFANATRSADGIPAIISGIPFFMNDPFPLSPYSTNQIDALPSLLKQKGYATSFFHGGANGTMNFDSYSRNAGFDHYYGRNEYKNDDDYDGTWGIWDEPFLQYFAKQLNQEKQPFFSTVFTLSSHEPFAIPQKYQDEPFAKLKGISRGISYSDMALRKFFQTASQQPWFQNTLFVITADHNYLAFHDPLQYYNQSVGLFAIPMLFYKPNDVALKGNNYQLIQQIDIMPSVLDYMHYDKSFFCFGKSVFDSTEASFLYTAIDNQYYMLQPPWLITANFDKVHGNYHFNTDSMMKHNLLSTSDSVFAINEKRFHAYLQLLHSSILHNRQSVETYR